MNSNASVVIEQAGPAHADVMAALHQTSFERPWSAKEFTRLMETPGTLGFLAVLDEKSPTAMILCRYMSGEAEILTLAVHPTMRRAAIGTELVKAATAQLRKVTDCLFLEVAEFNAAACALYAGMGFVEVGRRPGYYLTSGTRQDALVMRLDMA